MNETQARGRFIVLEGGEGSGKSTQVPRIAQRLRDEGCAVVVTFEPGATVRGAELRRFLLDNEDPLDPRAEMLVMAADRAQHVSEVVRPALARGTYVISDRFEPSTLAYQGSARGLGVDEVQTVSRWASGGLEPDLVVVIDVPDDVADARVPASRDRVEAAGTGFHAAVRAAYRDLAPSQGWVVLDGTGTPDEVTDAIWVEVAARLGLR